jgi:hypothetical protein
MSQVVSKNLYYEDTNVAVVKTCIVCGRIRTYADAYVRMRASIRMRTHTLYSMRTHT